MTPQREVAHLLSLGEDEAAARLARDAGRPDLLLTVGDATALRFRALSIQMRVEAADRLADRGTHRSYATAVRVLSDSRGAMQGEDLRWISLMAGYTARHRRRRALLAALRRAGLDPQSFAAPVTIVPSEVGTPAAQRGDQGGRP